MTSNGSAQPGISYTARIGMWSARHKWWVMGAWLLVIVFSMAVCTSTEADTDINNMTVGGGETDQATALLDQRFPVDEGEVEGTAQEILVFSHPNFLVTEQVYQDLVQGLLRQLSSLRVEETIMVGGVSVTDSRRIVRDTLSHYDLDQSAESSPFVAQNETGGHVTFALVQIDAAAVDGISRMSNITLVTDLVGKVEAESDGFEILIGGDATLTYQLSQISDEDFARASMINLPITFAILIIAFGALLAATVPLALGISSIIIAVAVIVLISNMGFPQSEIYQQMVLLLGLATGIDYSLFVITRYRNELKAGHTQEEALQIAMGTSGKSIVFAGATTVFALAGMFLVGIPVFTSLGFAAQVVVIVAVLSALTFLPALIMIFGGGINRLRVPFLGRGRAPDDFGVWGRVIDKVLARPLIPAVVTVVALLALSAPALTMNLGFNGPRSFPKDADGTKALIALEESFTLGLIQPAIAVVDAGVKQNVFAQDIQAAVAALLESVGQDTLSADNPDALYGPAAQEPAYSDAGDTAVISIPLNGDSSEDRSLDAVHNLRDNLVPAAFGDSSAEVLITGATAGNIDFKDNIQATTPLVFAFVLGLTFITLLLAFRSLVIAISAILLNLLSVGVAYGLLVLVFQEGYLLEGVLDFEATGIVESWLPLFLFSLLFGLSIDYEMFVMGRIKEMYEQGLSTDEAIAAGMKGTAAVITNAAAIMVAVALIFAFMRDLGMKQFGFGLAVAILFDATVIRAFVLPTSMKLLGDWNWYLPKWLKWLPYLPMSEDVPMPARTTAGD